MAMNRKFRWSDAADQLVVDAYARGVPADKLAETLGCSVNALRSRAYQIGARHRRANRTLEERFWDYVSPEPNSGCWLWDGAWSSTGYGQIRLKTRGPGSLVFATHLSLSLVGRPVPPGLNACHHCDTPACVNPHHLFIGTQKENIHDSMAKGRNSKPPICTKGSRPLKTACIHGHLRTPDNIYLRPDGHMACRACRTEIKARMRARRYAAGLTSRGTVRA